MKQQFGLIQRPWGVYYLKNKVTGEQTSLKTRDKREAGRATISLTQKEEHEFALKALLPHIANAVDVSAEIISSRETVTSISLGRA